MSASGADPQSESEPFRRESRIWGLIRRTLPLGRSIGSVFYLISVGLIAGWIIAVFFGVSIFSLMPRSAKLASGLSPGETSSNDPSAETPWLMQSTSRLDRLSGQLNPRASRRALTSDGAARAGGACLPTGAKPGWHSAPVFLN